MFADDVRSVGHGNLAVVTLLLIVPMLTTANCFYWYQLKGLTQKARALPAVIKREQYEILPKYSQAD